VKLVFRSNDDVVGDGFVANFERHCGGLFYAEDLEYQFTNPEIPESYRRSVRGIKSSVYFCCAKIFQVPFSLNPGEAVRKQPFNDGKLYLLRVTLTALHNQYIWVASIDQPPALWLYTRRSHALYTRILSYPTSCVDDRTFEPSRAQLHHAGLWRSAHPQRE